MSLFQLRTPLIRAMIFHMATNPTPRSLSARVAAHASWAATPDRTARVAPARAAFIRRIEDQIDPDRILTAEELGRRVDSALKAHYARMALKSLQVRQANAAARKAAEATS